MATLKSVLDLPLDLQNCFFGDRAASFKGSTFVFRFVWTVHRPFVFVFRSSVWYTRNVDTVHRVTCCCWTLGRGKNSVMSTSMWWFSTAPRLSVEDWARLKEPRCLSLSLSHSEKLQLSSQALWRTWALHPHLARCGTKRTDPNAKKKRGETNLLHKHKISHKKNLFTFRKPTVSGDLW